MKSETTLAVNPMPALQLVRETTPEQHLPLLVVLHQLLLSVLPLLYIVLQSHQPAPFFFLLLILFLRLPMLFYLLLDRGHLRRYVLKVYVCFLLPRPQALKLYVLGGDFKLHLLTYSFKDV